MNKSFVQFRALHARSATNQVTSRSNATNFKDSPARKRKKGDVITPCLLVAKSNNNGYRFVVDFRSLHKHTVNLDLDPLPTTDEELESLGHASPTYFSCLDLQSGFYQLEIDPSSRPLTACRCHLGLFQFKRLPMGLKNIPFTIQRIMEAVLRGLNWKSSLVYLDDVIVFSRTFQDHLLHLQQVFERLRSAELKLHTTKCNFAKREIRYLVNSEGISPIPKK
ncbi:Retrovirus-related Pol polyprotein from transposon 297,Retrovirus-related Pol polyprotein from transposon 17.6 [Mytilus coruscus]|uniref:Retrovirus-related Pol polyprotein from transposon 297,Retrovirus-related Pol polyprotein from transposon 17.6 n=1 Tax=Mytilus coruscus TaxID=42192 RepID=A0A6J8BDS8_MYTCO|nr:Retrovirus-related Pol polyprotein from transposon 297,Retrovirus-related Pol polyprotein from transposon 17.6 [Mytilus coruscus]